MPQVFLSYATENSDFAELTKHRLIDNDISVWIDQSDLHVGDDWKNIIDDGINSSDLMLVILSPESSKSTYVTYEWAYAMGRELRIIPIMFERGDIHPKLSDLQYLDFTNTRSRPWNELIDEISRYLAPSKDENEHPNLIEDELDNYKIAKDQILNYLERTNFKMVSFDRVRKNIDPNYNDDFLMNVIRTHHHILRRAILNGQKPGVTKL